jgi:hypothetical protein
MVVYGSRGEWSFPRLFFQNVQSRDNWSAICLLVATYPGLGNGFYRSNISMLKTQGGAVSYFAPINFNDVVLNSAALGATTLTMTKTRTEHNGSNGTSCYVAGLYIQIELDNGTFFITKITSSSSGVNCVITIADPLPRAVPAGNIIVVSPTKMINRTTPQGTPAQTSNTWQFVLLERPTRYGWVCTMLGTQDVFVNRYIDGSPSSGDVTSWDNTLINGIYDGVRNGDVHVMTNIEHFQHTDAAWFIGGDPASVGQVHAEGLRAESGSASIIGGTARSLNISLLQVVYCTMLSTGKDGAPIASCGIFGPRAGFTGSSNTQLGATTGEWLVGILHTGKNIIEPGIGFIMRDASGGKTKLDISVWNFERDSGFYPTVNLLDATANATPWNFSSSVTLNQVLKIGNLFPPNTVALRLDADLTTTAAQTMFATSMPVFKINKLAYRNASMVPTTATAGVFNESSATNLVSAVNNTALSALTSKTETIIEPGLSVNETGKTRTAGSRVFFKCAAAQAAPAAVLGVSSYLTGRNGGSKNTELGFINFGAPHGFVVGDVVVITGSVNGALNSTFKIVDVPTTVPPSTQIVVYVDSVSAVGSAASPIPDPGISVQLRPTVDVYALGDEYGVW